MNSSLSQLRDIIDSGRADSGFIRLYGRSQGDVQKRRYRNLLSQGEDYLSAGPALFISAPGRTELGGNHTDHNNGRVVAAAVDLDCVALIAPEDGVNIKLISDGFNKEIEVAITQLSPQPEETGASEALIRGVAAALKTRARDIGGFRCLLNSTCTPGTGLSSSAAFSVCIAAALSHLYNEQALEPVEIAQSAQYAENHFFGKPCGLMDQLSSAVGGVIAIDFMTPDNPVVTQLSESFKPSGYQLAVVDTGGSHSNLTDEYAAVTEEIANALHVFGQDVARGIALKDLLARLFEVRSHAGDRAALRLMHFITEDRRAARQARALQENRVDDFLQLVKESGASSCSLLQNCATSSSTREQGILLALALTTLLCPGAVCRVHGGGFAGTIQVYIPELEFESYRKYIDSIFGINSVMPIRTGRPGVCFLTDNGWDFATGRS